jgi:coenzyme F420-reducing hydrogenase delta subunit
MYNLSSSEGPLFAQIAFEMYEKIKEMGPNPIKMVKKKAA